MVGEAAKAEGNTVFLTGTVTGVSNSTNQKRQRFNSICLSVVPTLLTAIHHLVTGTVAQ